MTICICGHDISKHSQQGCMTIIDNGADKYCSCELTRMDVIKACAEAAEAERDDARRQLTEAQSAIDAMAQIVGAADTVRRQLEQAQSDIEDYRAEIARLTQQLHQAKLTIDNLTSPRDDFPYEGDEMEALQREAAA